MRIHISVDRSDPPAGTASAEGGQPQAYEGWLGLMGVLSDLVGDPGAREAGTLDGNSGSDTTMREEGPDG